MSTKGVTRLQKLQIYQRNIEAMILLTETDDDLRLLGASFLAAARRSLTSTEGFTKAKELMTTFVKDMKPPEDKKITIFKLDKPKNLDNIN